MPVFRFKTKWIFEAPVEILWQEINNPAEWPNWWRGLYKVNQIKTSHANGLGAVYGFTWGNPWIFTLKFDLEITAIQPFKYIRGKASGDIEGIGTWYFTQENELAHVEYNWHVRTRKPMLNLLAIFLRPVLVLNHKIIMLAGAKGLAKRLNIKLKNLRKAVRQLL
ncbi:MAG: SRPBCC family protein [Bacteroidia bacterium]